MTDLNQTDRNGSVYLVSAARTPIGKFGGALSGVSAVELGGVAIRAAIERSGLPEETPIIGQVIQAGAGQAPARQAALRRAAAEGADDADGAIDVTAGAQQQRRLV